MILVVVLVSLFSVEFFFSNYVSSTIKAPVKENFVGNATVK